MSTEALLLLARLDRGRLGLAALAVAGAAACSGPPCGPGEPAAPGITATIGAAAITYGTFTSSPNNDCTPAGGGPTSLALDGLQVSPSPSTEFHIHFCLPRPDEIGAEPISLTDERRIYVATVSAEVDGCGVSLDRNRFMEGALRFVGYCDAGLHRDGYRIEIAATAAGIKRCPVTGGGTSSQQVEITLAGAADVTALTARQ